MVFAADGSGTNIYYPARPGQVVKFSGWGSRVSGDGLARLVMEVTDSTKANPTWITSIPDINNASWTLTSGSYTVPAGKAFVRFYMEIKNPTRSSEVRFDDSALQIR